MGCCLVSFLKGVGSGEREVGFHLIIPDPLGIWMSGAEVELPPQQNHQTKVHRKTLNPVFNKVVFLILSLQILFKNSSFLVVKRKKSSNMNWLVNQL